MEHSKINATALCASFAELLQELGACSQATKENARVLHVCERLGGLMVSALDSGSRGPGSRPGRGHCVVFIGKTLHSHSASLHPGV